MMVRDEGGAVMKKLIHIFQPHTPTSPRLRKRVLLLLYVIQIFGKQVGDLGKNKIINNDNNNNCNITGREALSAIQRAQTPSCKNSIQAIACDNMNNQLYPTSLPRLCKNNVTSYGRHLGCFKDDEKTRILPDSFSLFKSNNSPQICMDKCLQSGFQYAGVQYAVECFCGNQRPSENLEIHASECKMKCPLGRTHESKASRNIPRDSSNKLSSGADGKFCGGFFAMNVYETGVFHDTSKNNAISFQDFRAHSGALPPVRIVFLLTLNGRAYRQVIRLVKNLFHKRHFFYIHVDARQDYLYRELLFLKTHLANNVRFVSERRATIWGGASLLTVLLSAMEDLVTKAKEWDWKWDYVINLSESDFPLKTTEELEKFLSLSKGKNFIKSHGRDVDKFILKQGLDKTFFECENRMWRIGDRSLPKGIVIDGGSDWIALHREFVEYIVLTNDTLVQGLKTVFKYTLLPAESFFHTVLRNSAFCHTFVDNNLHVTNWKRKLGCKCQYRNVVDWCGCSPNDFRVADWPRLQMTENRLLFFARKFESAVSQGVVNNLESWLNPERAESHAKTSDRFWQSIYHHHDLSPKWDDAVKTLGFSLGRRALAYMSSILFSKSCQPPHFQHLLPSPNRSVQVRRLPHSHLDIVEMNLFLRHDIMEGILVRFVEKGEDEVIEAEAWFTFKTVISEIPNTGSRFQGRIRQMQVGLEYDQKEQIFRHFSRAMGPGSEPTLAYNCITDETFNVTFLWVDPQEQIQTVVNISVPEGSTSNFIKPSLKTPLLPGLWTVQIFSQDGIQLSQVHFVIFPLQFSKGKSLWSSLPAFQYISPSLGATEGQSELSSLHLASHIDALSSRMFALEDTCMLSGPFHSLENAKKYACVETEWSSAYPDPKSTIDGIDKKTGLLLP